MEEKNEAEKKWWYTQEEMKQIRKSDFYREDLAQYLGQEILLDCPFYEFKPYKEDKNRACLRHAEIIGVGDDKLPDGDPVLKIEHIWVAIKKTVKIDSRKPIRIVGIPYEYAHKCGTKLVKNVGLNVRYVTQRCFSIA